jgi:hypothetical protein
MTIFMSVREWRNLHSRFARRIFIPRASMSPGRSLTANRHFFDQKKSEWCVSCRAKQKLKAALANVVGR